MHVTETVVATQEQARGRDLIDAGAFPVNGKTDTRADDTETVTVMNRQPRGILDTYSKNDVRRLFEYLHNENPPHRYVFGFRGKGSEPLYKNADRFRRLPASQSIDWAVETMGGTKAPSKRHAYVPLPNNPAGKSRWGGFDFDAHNAGEIERASDLALKCFLQVVNEPFFTVLETSGVGFKLWMIANEFRDVSWWIDFLESVCHSIGVTPQPGVVELFPDRQAKNYGRGLRAFGTWNPRNDSLNGILFDDLGRLLEALPATQGGVSYLSSRGTDASVSRGTDGLEKFLIREPATRHNQLLGLVGILHVRCCRDIARQAAQEQFEKKTVETNADLAAHLAEFDAMWDAKLLAWNETLTPNEAQHFSRLTTDAERTAFRIIRDLGRSASHSGGSQFPISRDSLAARIQISGEGAGHLRRRFCHAGIMKRTKKPVPHVQCAHYQWTATFDVVSPVDGKTGVQV